MKKRYKFKLTILNYSMFLENNYIIFNNKLNINFILAYRILMTKFINKYIQIYKIINNKENINNNLIKDSLIFSKYYVYYKTLNCVYSNDIMEILINVDHNKNF